MASVVKGSFSRAWGKAGRGKIQAHKDYIEWRPDEPGTPVERERDTSSGRSVEKELEEEEKSFGAEEKGRRRASPRPFFSADEDHVPSRSIDRAIRDMKEGEAMFRLMMSPGHQGVDARAYVREVMAQLSRQKGQDLRWTGNLHENTDHQHVHVMLWGEDKEGGRVSIYKDDFMRMRAYGDRMIERELGIEHIFTLEEEEFARGRGLNLNFGDDRSRFMDVLNVPADQVWEANKKIEPIISTLEWSIFDDEWRKFQVDYTGREPRAQLGSSTYHDLGRQSDFTQLGDNKAEKEFWENFGNDDPEKKEIADDKLGTIKEGDDFLRELIDGRTKIYDDIPFLDGLLSEMEEDSAELQALLLPQDRKELERETAEIGDGYTEIDGLLGLDASRDSDAENPLKKDFEMDNREDFFDKLLGNSINDREVELERGAEFEPDGKEGQGDDGISDAQSEGALSVVNQEDDWSGVEKSGEDDGGRKDDEDDITFDPSGMY